MLEFLLKVVIKGFRKRSVRLSKQADERMVLARTLEEKRISLIKQAAADDRASDKAVTVADSLEDILK